MARGWISSAEAKGERTVGKEEWWKKEGIGGRTVELKQYHPGIPQEKHILMWKDGDMYLGEWKSNEADGKDSMHGFGIYYSNQKNFKGRVLIGNWKDGKPHGPGKTLWLESSPIWIKNECPISRIKEEVDGKLIGRPHLYEGNYGYYGRHDPSAKVTLKDGTCRVGPWEKDRPVGDWWNDDDHPRAATAADSQDVDTTEETRSTKRPRREPPAEAPHEDTKPVARNAEQAGSVAAANEESSDDDSTVQPDAPPSSAATIVLTTSDGTDRVHCIAQWLTETIGCDPEPELMDHYAHKFYVFGFQNLVRIVRDCTKEDLESFDWLKPLDKRQIYSKLEELRNE